MLAAYRPVPSLFAAQLSSLQTQERNDFRCLIGADGDRQEVARLVRELVGADDRFEVIGWDDNVGFYRNFERLLAAVPDDVGWVALSDQDDRWYPDKLQRLVPLLDKAPLATGQARVMAWPEGRVWLSSTNRRRVPAEDLLFQNQVTGSFSVFRRDLLRLALPFPRLRTDTQLHDHWLAMCAAVSGGYEVLDQSVQDYLQHDVNQVGERVTRERWTVGGYLRRTRRQADQYEGGHALTSWLRMHQVQTFGWRRLLVRTLAERTVLPPALDRVHSQLALQSPCRVLVPLLWRATQSPHTDRLVAASFLPGVPYEVWTRLRTR